MGEDKPIDQRAWLRGRLRTAADGHCLARARACRSRVRKRMLVARARALLARRAIVRLFFLVQVNENDVSASIPTCIVPGPF